MARMKKYINTLCFDCQNAVPDKRGHGCEWSISLTPVPGWDAIPVTVLFSGRQTPTFHVRGCPRFLADEPRESDNLELPDGCYPE